MTAIGITQSRLDEIELRLIGADHRPWEVSGEFFDENGRPLIVKASKKAHRKAEWGALAFDGQSTANTRLVSEIRSNNGADVERPRPSGGPPTHVDRAAYVKAVALFRLCDQASTDMGHFIANAPQDIEDLVAECRRLRSKLREVEAERDDMKKEMLSSRVEKQSLSEKYSDLRKSLREFSRVMQEVVK